VGIARLPAGDKLHHKFAVIDKRTVITGSFNWSPSAACALYTHKDCLPAGLN
jgi:phosphatidylserine/phosphatidylglycerophosphate/cardiolipin synthase-like enzyme